MAKHGTWYSYTRGCRCDLCAEGARAYRRDARARAAASGDIPHGTANGYINLGCRCGACRAANAAGVRAQVAKPVDPKLCPSLLNYKRRCRCDGCRGLHNEMARRIRARKRVAA